MPTVAELLEQGIRRLHTAGSETPRLDAEVLLAHILGIDRTGILAHPEAPVGDGLAAQYVKALDRRETGEPVAYVRGVKEFHSLAFATDARALIPRPETELLVDLAVAEVARRLLAAPRPIGIAPLRIVDVGTGGGAVIVTLAVLLDRLGMLGEVDLMATDADAAALDLARENAVGHGMGDRIRFELADLLPGELPGRWDLILANLPYVRTDAIAGLPPAAAFEPRQALDGGSDGLVTIGRLLDLLPDSLDREGIALIEIGADQADAMDVAVADRLRGWSCAIEPDLAGLPRVARVMPP
ncbi:MAG TPA: HemK/PrmC family methyltransferase [Candidatus Eisenbacteria bacterium]|nr:HemK/PrmC family methyltransferase [Candidatus Eisenbacteria bacterium]